MSLFKFTLQDDYITLFILLSDNFTLQDDYRTLFIILPDNFTLKDDYRKLYLYYCQITSHCRMTTERYTLLPDNFTLQDDYRTLDLYYGQITWHNQGVYLPAYTLHVQCILYTAGKKTQQPEFERKNMLNPINISISISLQFKKMESKSYKVQYYYMTK